MASLVGTLTSVGNPFDGNWSLLFARQPEPDLEFTDEELDQTTTIRSTGPLNPRKKSGGGRKFLWILILALIGGITYVATMEPELVTEWLGPYLGETTPPPVAMKPKPSTPAPAAIPTPAPPVAPVQAGETGAPPAPAATAVPPPAAPAAMPPSQMAATKPAAPVAPSTAPMFSEGQKVTITMAETASTTTSSPLFADASGNMPGPVVRFGATLTVLDGDLQPGGWMYLVRTDEGAKGWVSEKRLRLKF